MELKNKTIVVTGGGRGIGAFNNFSAYVAGKGAVWRLTETVGAELAPHGVYVDAVAPGMVGTRLSESIRTAGPEMAGRAAYDAALEQSKKGDAAAEKSAKLALYLFSAKAKGLSGRILSAVWDNYGEIADPYALSKSDLYAMRRVLTPEGGTRYSGS